MLLPYIATHAREARSLVAKGDDRIDPRRAPAGM
jgi:hypothetical protein